MFILLLNFLTAFVLTYFAIPSIIKVAHQKKLFDVPVGRSSHTVNTPSLGGIAIFSGAIFSFIMWTPFEEFANLQYILCAFIILFLVGARDDIAPLSPKYKLAGQILAALILIFKSDIILDGFYGLFGITADIPYWVSVIITLFTMLVIINAFNLIDGIDGLAGSIGVLIIGTLGAWFFLTGNWGYTAIAFATVGAITGFLKYNFTPAKIFMGDTGALLIGLASCILVIEFIDMNTALESTSPYKFQASPVVAIGILIIPLFDTLRVFITRIIRGHSPFHPDRRHIHHLLIDYGFGHTTATMILFFVNMFFICFVLWGHNRMGMHVMLGVLGVTASIMTFFLHKAVVHKKKLQLLTEPKFKKNGKVKQNEGIKIDQVFTELIEQ
ncbi:MAG: undecaprenyl/decaprenyl-phosphate alpha-N-acetylglucosaminyl 1-phosphate transferase [Bacteroidetes bacterium]|nr:MAG: undecaprenyl/decaprenyl-phosphate alpha-N-acetylglucosaminyl 1-phosphate transferase [Bacteroidota bacterium]